MASTINDSYATEPSTRFSQHHMTLTSSIWTRLPHDLLGEIAPYLATEDVSISTLVRYSELCRFWRVKLSPYIFYQVTIRVRSGLNRIEDTGLPTEAIEGVSDVWDLKFMALHRFLQFIREAQSSIGPHIVTHINRLIITERWDAGWSFPLPTSSESNTIRSVAQKNAELLTDILSHFRHLHAFELDAFMPVDGFRISELVKQRLDLHSGASPWTPLSVDHLRVKLSIEHVDRILLHVGVTRFVGLLALFGRVGHLDVDGDPAYTEPFHINLPSLPQYLQISEVTFQRGCTRPNIIRTIISPSTLADLRSLEIDGISADNIQGLAQVLLNPALDPEHLILAVEDPPGGDTLIPLELTSKKPARLREVTLRLCFLDYNDDYDSDETYDQHYYLLRWAIDVLSYLDAPSTFHSVRKVNLAIDGSFNVGEGMPDHIAASISPSEDADQLPELVDELDQLLFDLHAGECGIQTSVMLRKQYGEGPWLPIEESSTLQAELFPFL